MAHGFGAGNDVRKQRATNVQKSEFIFYHGPILQIIGHQAT
jgi:hypothetical protein